MTDDQPTLFKPPAPVAVLHAFSDRQRQAWELLLTVPGGVTADEIGARVHDHDDDLRCDWCASAGKELMTSAALGPLVIRRRESGKWEPRDPALQPQVGQSMQLVSDLPGESFADIFGDAS